MILNTSQITTITSGLTILAGLDHPVRSILLDSRKISHVTDALFIAIKGEHHDSHKYLKDVYNAGVRSFIIEQEADLTALPEANVIRVSNSTVALQQLATHHRKQFAFPTIGITGSNGKTIVKEWLNTMLADDYHIVRSPKSWNSQIGVPLSVMNIESNHTLGIFEAGISKPGEMERLAKVIAPTIGIFTSIGTAHSENFLSRRQLIGEKLNLFAPAEIVICPDDGELAQLISAWSGSKQIVLVPQVERATIGMHNNVTTLRLEWKNSAYEFDIPFADKASVENAITCIHCLFVLKYDAEEIQSRLARLTPLEMRLQLLDGNGDSVIVNDAYSNDLQSLEIALDFLQQHARGRKKIVILSDILQSGLNEKDLHERINNLLQAKNISQLIGIGKGMSASTPLSFGDGLGVRLFASTEEFLQKINVADFAHSALLVKGARDFRFERIVAQLQEKTHDTVLEINLNALAHNLHYYRNKLKPETKVMAMVKAFGYGSGAHEVASLLEFNKVDYLAVAYTDEGVALRKAGVSLPIMVMNAEQGSLATLIRHKLEPEIFSLRTLNAFVRALQNAGITNPYLIHIKLDTGMHRLGFEAPQVMELLGKLQVSPQLKIASVFTHLAAADESEHDPFTLRQLDDFENICKQIKKSLKQNFLMHALNTGGISRFTHSQFDMVRLGVGLYGVEVSAEDKGQLQSVSTLKTIISQIKNIKVGESVGYSRKFVATSNMRIATIPVGYADGLRRTLSNGVGEVIIKNTRCKVVGNVCMDMMMVDISHANCNEGDEVIVFGREISLHELAKKSGTIEYEILTSISQRVKRVYVSE